MNAPVLLSHGGHRLVPSSRIGSDANTPRAPKVVIADIGEPLATALAAHFGKHGWRVKRAANADEARRLAASGTVHGVILPVASFAESGFLACAKLVLGLPKTRVILVGEDSEENERFALFAGAAGYATRATPANEVAEILTGEFAPMAN